MSRTNHNSKMIPEEAPVFVTLAAIILATIVHHYAKDDYSGLLSALSLAINGIFFTLMIVFQIVPTPNPVINESISYSNFQPVVAVGFLISIASAILLFKIRLLSKIKGDKLLLRDEPIAYFHERELSSECRYNSSARCNFYLNYREGDSQYILPIEDLDGLANILDKDVDLDDSITCCRCENLQPKYTGIAHATDLQEPKWSQICEDCTKELINKAMEKEDNYISEELVLSRAV